MSNAEPTPLAPCPYCVAAGDLHIERHPTYVRCGDCFGDGPIRDTPRSAIEAWNHRPQVIAMQQVVEAARAVADAWEVVCGPSGNGEMYVARMHALRAALASLPSPGPKP